MADSGIVSTNPPDPPSQEAAFLDLLRRYERNRAGSCAVHFHFADLRPQFRQPHYIRIATRAFDNLVQNQDAHLFAVASADVILYCRNVKIDDIDAVILKLRALFSEDPLTLDEPGSPDDRFTTWYDLSQNQDFRGLTALVERMLAENAQRRRRGGAGRRPGMAGKDMDPANLAAINRRLGRTRIADLIRQQNALEIEPGGRGRVVFREHYMAIGELQERVAPDVNLFGSPWLFQYLTETLDRRMLAVVARRNFESMKQPISLNLNISTVLSPEFRHFHDQARNHAGLVVIEFQIIDIFADIERFEQARDWLQQKGYRVLIDGLSPMTLQFFDPALLKPDFIKINWTPELLDGTMPLSRMVELRDLVEFLGQSRVVLARVENEQAVKWAVQLGIRQMQGRFIDRLASALAAKGSLPEASTAMDEP